MSRHVAITPILFWTYCSAQGSAIRQRKIVEALLENRPVGPVKVGDKLSTWIDQSESSAILPALGEDGSSLFYHIMFREGAPYITVHFSDFDLGSSCKMIVAGKDLPDGRQQVYEMVGKGKMELGTFWTQHVKGDTIDLLVECPAGVQAIEETHFVIDEVAVGFLENGSEHAHEDIAEAVCGTADFQNVICYAGTEQYTKARAVARQLINGDGWCTGWLASSSNHFITNEHCVADQSQANDIDFEFGAEAPTCATPNCANCHTGAIFSGSTFLKASATYDYAVLQLAANVSNTFGFLEIDDRTAVVGEQIYIPQHPAKRAKEFGMVSSHSSDNGFCLVQTVGDTVKYYCDTEGGSSGSPVLAFSSNKVIALHCCGGCLNNAIPINRVYAEISGILNQASSTPAPAPAPCRWSDTLLGWTKAVIPFFRGDNRL